MHQDLHRFRYCPSCRAEALSLQESKAIACGQCGFRYYHNTAAAVAAVICLEDQLLLTRRAFAPGAGLLDFPGGFVDPGESLEEALLREVAEELDLALPGLTYLFSLPNHYSFRDTGYRVCDAYFGVRLAELPPLKPADDVADFKLVKLRDADPGEMAFPAQREALARLQGGELAGLLQN